MRSRAPGDNQFKKRSLGEDRTAIKLSHELEVEARVSLGCRLGNHIEIERIYRYQHFTPRRLRANLEEDRYLDGFNYTFRLSDWKGELASSRPTHIITCNVLTFSRSRDNYLEALGHLTSQVQRYI